MMLKENDAKRIGYSQSERRCLNRRGVFHKGFVTWNDFLADIYGIGLGLFKYQTISKLTWGYRLVIIPSKKNKGQLPYGLP